MQTHILEGRLPARFCLEAAASRKAAASRSQTAMGVNIIWQYDKLHKFKAECMLQLKCASPAQEIHISKEIHI